jgi:hypothetical protein
MPRKSRADIEQVVNGDPEYEEDVFSGEIEVPNVFKRSDLVPTVRQGSKDLMRFFVWNTITPCHEEDCPIWSTCPHEKVEGGKCKVERGYVSSVATMAYRVFRKKFSEDQFFVVGMHILPLYRHLCRLKVWEWSVRHVMYEDEKGKRHINPIYREIREQLKAISAQWRMLGVGRVEIPEPRDPRYYPPLKDANPKPYYERMGEIEATGDKET